jgi:hypothetical protein
LSECFPHSLVEGMPPRPKLRQGDPLWFLGALSVFFSRLCTVDNMLWFLALFGVDGIFRFQEIVPLNTNNVLCVEDDAPTIIWDGLIRQALNNRVKCCERPQRSCSVPVSPVWHEKDVISEVPEVSDVNGLMSTIVTEEALESSLLLQKLPKSSDSQWLKEKTRARNIDQTVKGLTKNVKTAEDWLSEASMPDDDVTEDTPLVNSSQILGKHSCNQYSRVASKQMVGIFISVWVRSDLRRYVNNVKVCVVGCGILNFLRNKVYFDSLFSSFNVSNEQTRKLLEL